MLRFQACKSDGPGMASCQVRSRAAPASSPSARNQRAASEATPRPARLLFSPGEIHDYEFTRATPGDLLLEFGKGPPWYALTRVPVRVR
jgi:hypothetical protein